MSAFSQLDFQQSLYTKLTGDSALMALIEGVYDRPPQESTYPYVLIGDMDTRDWSTKTSTGNEHLFTLHIYSREGGRRETMQIMERLHTLLHDGSMSVAGHILVMMRFLISQIGALGDGWSYHGAMRFRALVEAV